MRTMIDPAARVLGVDAGATKTIGLLADGRGEVLRSARGAASNLQARRRDRIERELGGVMGEALGNAPHRCRLDAICIGMAGADRDHDFAEVREMVARLGYAAPVLVVNDALIALVAGLGNAPGVVIVAGTGSIAYGRSARGTAARAGGWGYVLGDEGSGYWLGRQALRAVVRASDGRGQPTAITGSLLAALGITRPHDLMRTLAARAPEPADIAALAPHVQRAFDGGDAVATAILDRAAGELGRTATAVITRLQMETEAFGIVLAGTVFKAVPSLVGELSAKLSAVAPGGRPTVLEGEPATGAVRLALETLLGRATLPVYIDG